MQVLILTHFLLQSINAYKEHQESKHRIINENFFAGLEEAIIKQYSEDKQIIETIVPIETKNLTVIFCRLCKKVFQGKREYRNHFEIDHKDKLEFAKTHNVEKDLICSSSWHSLDIQVLNLVEILTAFISEVHSPALMGWQSSFEP